MNKKKFHSKCIIFTYKYIYSALLSYSKINSAFWTDSLHFMLGFMYYFWKKNSDIWQTVRKFTVWVGHLCVCVCSFSRTFSRKIDEWTKCFLRSPFFLSIIFEHMITRNFHMYSFHTNECTALYTLCRFKKKNTYCI